MFPLSFIFIMYSMYLSCSIFLVLFVLVYHFFSFLFFLKPLLHIFKAKYFFLHIFIIYDDIVYIGVQQICKTIIIFHFYKIPKKKVILYVYKYQLVIRFAISSLLYRVQACKHSNKFKQYHKNIFNEIIFYIGFTNLF